MGHLRASPIFAKEKGISYGSIEPMLRGLFQPPQQVRKGKNDFKVFTPSNCVMLLNCKIESRKRSRFVGKMKVRSLNWVWANWIRGISETFYPLGTFWLWVAESIWNRCEYKECPGLHNWKLERFCCRHGCIRFSHDVIRHLSLPISCLLVPYYVSSLGRFSSPRGSGYDQQQFQAYPLLPAKLCQQFHSLQSSGKHLRSNSFFFF